MSTITADLDLTGLSITGNLTVTVSTQDIYGVSMTIATITQDWTGYTLVQFINTLVTEINSGASGFIASNENPILRLTRSSDIDPYVGEQVDLEFTGSHYSASWIKDAASDFACPQCYALDLFSCYGNYLIDIGLEANTTYNLIIKDKFGKKYIDQVTSNADGAVLITVANFPEGLLTPENGVLTLYISDVNGDDVAFIVGYVSYDCAQLNSENMDAV